MVAWLLRAATACLYFGFLLRADQVSRGRELQSTETYNPKSRGEAGVIYCSPIIEQLGTHDVETGGAVSATQYRLLLHRESPKMKNIYTIFGDEDSVMTMPPAFQSAGPATANVGGIDPILVHSFPMAAYDSWLTVGKTEGDPAGAISAIGIVWTEWTATVGLAIDNGAVFWMEPPNGPTEDDVVIAQLTIPNDQPFVATVAAQGESHIDGQSFRQLGIRFVSGTLGSTLPPSPSAIPGLAPAQPPLPGPAPALEPMEPAAAPAAMPAATEDNCADTDGWADSEGDACEEYSVTTFCFDENIVDFAVDGVDANTACCLFVTRPLRLDHCCASMKQTHRTDWHRSGPYRTCKNLGEMMLAGCLTRNDGVCDEAPHPASRCFCAICHPQSTGH
jgi:hypothetical protein